MKEISSAPIGTSTSSNQNNQNKERPVNKRLEAALAARRSPESFTIQFGRFIIIKKPKSD